jgi:large subunit ribosomal protein L15
MFRLDNLQPLCKKRKRVGRGGSRGGTAGRGHKGQKARTSGTVRPGYEGGQMPLFRRLPKRGFSNAAHKKDIVVVNLEQLEAKFQDGELVTRQSLIEKGIIKAQPGKKDLVVKGYFIKILADGELKKKLTIEADAFSAKAREAIEKVGGKVKLNQEI